MAEKKGWKEIPIGGMIIEPGNSAEFKTGDWKSFRPIWDESKCTQCMICVPNCPEDCIPRKEGKRIDTDLSVCKGCGICANVCPVKCIEMRSEGDFNGGN